MTNKIYKSKDFIALPNLAEGTPSNYVIYRNIPRKIVCRMYDFGDITFADKAHTSINGIAQIASIVKRIHKSGVLQG